MNPLCNRLIINLSINQQQKECMKYDYITMNKDSLFKSAQYCKKKCLDKEKLFFTILIASFQWIDKNLP